MTVLKMENVTHHYPGQSAALSDVTFDMQQGEVIGLVGCNGAGKSTLLQVALGLLSPREGQVQTVGACPQTDPMLVRRRVGYSADDKNSKTGATVKEMLALHKALFPSWDDAFAARLLGPLAEQEHKRIDKLSLGQARRVLLSCAIAHRPQLLLLDEPSNGLDPSVRREFLELTVELLAEQGTSVVLSSHHLADVERIASRVLVLDKGRILLDAATDDLQENYCLVDFDGEAAGVQERLANMAGWVSCRLRGRHSQAVFQAVPEELSQGLLSQGVEAGCRRANLEDLFIALVGETS